MSDRAKFVLLIPILSVLKIALTKITISLSRRRIVVLDKLYSEQGQ
jgi:hypothetical protein